MRQACLDAQGVWVDMSDLGGDEKNFARSSERSSTLESQGTRAIRECRRLRIGYGRRLRSSHTLWKA